MKANVYIATSLDGFIARKDGSVYWLTDIENPPKEDYGYEEFVKNIDCHVMGRHTFDLVLSFPRWVYTKKVFVLSSTLKSLPEELTDKVEVISMPPKEVFNHLSKLGYNNIYVDGGKTVQGFLKEDLIDEITITKVPILIGSGFPLFGCLDYDIKFSYIDTVTYPNGLVKCHYKRIRE